jgi:putative transposase
MRYRRDLTSGATYFFTVVTFRRNPLFAQPENVERLRAAIRDERARRSFSIDAVVILPDHIHAIWTLPPDDADYSMRWRNIKRSFTTAVRSDQRPYVFGGRWHKQEQAIWQRRFWEHRICDQEDFNRHVDYIHYNPVNHGYVSRPGDWPYSSLHHYILQGRLPPDWGASSIVLPEGIVHE